MIPLITVEDDGVTKARVRIMNVQPIPFQRGIILIVSKKIGTFIFQDVGTTSWSVPSLNT